MKTLDEKKAFFENNDRTVLVNSQEGSKRIDTIMEYIKHKSEQDSEKRILVLAFDKNTLTKMRESAKKHGITNQFFKTINGFAFKYIKTFMPNFCNRFSNSPTDISVYRDFLGNDLHVSIENKTVATKFIVDTFKDFCKSDKKAIKNFLENETTIQAIKNMRELNINEDVLLQCLIKLENDFFSQDGKLPIPTEFCAKFVYMNNSTMMKGYDEIIIDDAQDMTKCAIDLILRQNHARRIFIGDKFQHVFGNIGYVNAFSLLEDVPVINISQNMHCPEEIAKIIRPYLAVLGADTFFRGNSDEVKDNDLTCHLARTNLSVLSILEDLHRQGIPDEKICLWGGKRSYNFSSLKDLAYLKSGEKDKISTFDIRFFDTIHAYYDYALATGDASAIHECAFVIRHDIKEMIALLEKFANARFSDIPIEDGIVVSTAQKARGTTFGNVIFDQDFWNFRDELFIHDSKAKKGDDEILQIPFNELRMLYAGLASVGSTLDTAAKQLYTLSSYDLNLIYKLLDNGKMKTFDKDEKNEETDQTETSMKGIEKYSDLCQEVFKQKQEATKHECSSGNAVLSANP